MAEDLTVGQLARQAGLSRSTLLYYDRLGLLRPVNRSDGNYRLYGPADVERLGQIRFYRKMGVPLKDVARLLDRNDRTRSEEILRDRLQRLEAEIESLEAQQRDVMRLLEQLASRKGGRRRGPGSRRAARARKSLTPSIKENEMVSKERLVEIMRAAGFSEENMGNFHRQFERMEPEAHEEFLQSLGIEAAEICQIRATSRQ